MFSWLGEVAIGASESVGIAGRNSMAKLAYDLSFLIILTSGDDLRTEGRVNVK